MIRPISLAITVVEPLLLIIVCVSFFIHGGLSEIIPSKFTRLLLPSAVGPEALAFESSTTTSSGVFYTGVTDGRIFKYQGPHLGFVEFATTSPIRNRRICDGTNDPVNLRQLCGRPLGMGFNNQTRQLYVVDQAYGLLVVGPNGGLATQLATGVDGVPFAFPNALDIDPTTGVIYFTDSGAIFQTNNNAAIILSRDTTSLLLRYEPMTLQVTVLLRNLSGAAGVAVSKDGTFVMINELIRSRVRKYWLKGPKANTWEIIATFPALYNDNIKRSASGDFWIAANTPVMVPKGLKINENGTIVDTFTVNLVKEYNFTIISEVQENGDALYIGSLLTQFVGKFQLRRS